MELFNGIVESLTTPYCILKYGGVEQCQFTLKMILIGTPIAFVVMTIIGIINSRSGK